MTIGVAGGPTPWPGVRARSLSLFSHAQDPSKFSESVTAIEEPSAVAISSLRSVTGAPRSQSHPPHALGSHTWRYYRIMCRALGSQVITVRVGSLPSASNPHPVEREISLLFTCAEPRDAFIYPVVAPGRAVDDVPQDCAEGAPVLSASLRSRT